MTEDSASGASSYFDRRAGSGTVAAMNPTLVEAMNAACARWPKRTALRMGSRSLSYAELHARANALAHHLADRGVGRESRVAVAMERSLDLIVALVAVWKAGAAYVPLDPEYPSERIAFMLEDSGARAVLLQSRLRGELPALGDRVVIEVDRFEGEGDAPAPPAPNDLAYVIYTSGSTGRPKGAMIEHGAITNRILWMQDAFALGEDDVVLQKTPTSFDVSVWELFWSHCVGACMELAEPGGHRDDVYLADLIAERGVTTCHFVPSMLVAFLDTPNVGRCASSLRRVICSGEALPVDLVRRFRDRLPGVELHNLYGPTEAAVDVSHWPVDFDADVVPIGKAITGVTLDVVDPETLQRVADGDEGELWIGGVQVGRGYLDRPELTAEKFIDDPFRPGGRIYRTGDRVRRLPSGDIEFLGRFDHQVKIRGFRIELGEIEARLLELDEVREATVIAADDRLVAYAVPSSTPEREPESVAVWGDVFDATYAESGDDAFDLAGWNSSYTGEAIPPETMRAWLDGTLERIRALAPRRVLELGCGTGMILFGLAEHVERYVGVDLSAKAIADLRGKVAAKGWSHIELSAAPAHAIAELETDAFDLVVVNSVLQFFPGARYLRRIIEEGWRVVRDGGHLFFGDVRSLPHVHAFHDSVERARAPELGPDELRTRVLQAIALEEELLVAPELFASSGDGFGGFECLWRRGRGTDEMTRFRYDAILHVGPRENSDPRVVAWTSTADIDGAEDHVRLTGIPNARIVEDGIEPEDLIEHANERGFDARAVPGASPEAFDLLLDRRGTPRSLEPIAPLASEERESQWVSNPGRGLAARELRRTWRTTLRTTLPDYMVPSALVLLPEMPLTPSGKVDRKLLPPPVLMRREESVRPRGETEAAIAAIWREVLGVDDIGIHENFFDLGGDSIVALQIAAKARDAGLPLSPAVLFRLHTIAELANEVGEGTAVHAEQGRIDGAQTLTAMQAWSLEHAKRHLERSVMLAHLTCDAPSAGSLRAALEKVVAHHDALRLCFDGETLRYGDHVGIEVLEGDGPWDAGLDLAQGPVGRLWIAPNGITLALSHMVGDGYSVRLLLEDLERALAGASFPSKSTSFQHAAKRLAERAGAGEHRAYWREVATNERASLPGEATADLQRDEATLTRVLDAELTKQLLVDAAQALDVGVDDLLLSATAWALRAWTNEHDFVIDTESHGREPLFDDVDLSRTFGVFSALYPVRLSARDSVLKTLRAVHEERKRIPNKGVDFGLLRYVDEDPVLAEAPRCEVLFNFLGRFDDPGRFRMLPGPTGARAPDEPRAHPVLIEAKILGGELHVEWSWDGKRFVREDVEAAADAQIAALREMVDPPHEAARYPLCPLSDTTLRELADALIEDVYPIAALQEGMLLHTALHPESDVYHVQIGGRVQAPLDEERLARAWKQVVLAHPILRTRFVMEHGVQLVVADAEPRFFVSDWRDGALRPKLVEAATRRDYAMDAAGLTTLEAGRLDEGFAIAWRFHHALLDGWSMMDVLEELLARYADPDARIPRRPPYRRYVDWAAGRDHSASDAVFRELLGSVREATPLPTDREPDDEPIAHTKTTLQLDPEPVRGLAQKERVTINTVVQGLWTALLAHWSGQRDVVFGAVVPGRSLPGADRLVGLLMNTLPVRSTIEDADLGDWLRAQQAAMVALREHEHMPLARAQKLASLAPGAPLLSSVISVQGYLRGAGSLEEWANGIGVTDLSFVDWNDLPLSVAVEVGDALSVTLKLDHRRFGPAAIERIASDTKAAFGALSARTTGELLAHLADEARARRMQAASPRSGPRSGPKKRRKPSAGPRSGPRARTRKAMPSDRREWVRVDRLDDNAFPIPAVIRPAVPVDLPTWAAEEHEYVESLLREHRALLFRGFGVNDVSAFEKLVAATSEGDPLEYRDRTTPRTTKATGVYTSTIHPADQTIHLHNEGTYWTRWAQKLYFACMIAASEGGATPIADVARVYERIDPSIRREFEARGMMLVRNYNDGFGLPWEEVFQSGDRAAVEAYCSANDIAFEWKDGGRLRTRSVRPAVRRHPRTGEKLWFNHVAFFHWTTLEDDIRDALLTELGEEGLPYNTMYGDGGSIPPDVVEALRRAYDAERVAFPWESGDVMLLDNMAVAHSRQPYRGEREVVVAMTEPVGDDDLPPLNEASR